MKLSSLVIGSLLFLGSMAALSFVGGPDILVRRILELVFFPLNP